MDNTPNYYAIIPAFIRYDKNLCANAKLLYAEITALTNSKGYCYATNRYFAELYSVSNETVSRWISKLAKCKYIEIHFTYVSGTKEIEERQIRLGYVPSQISIPIDENVKGGIDKNVKDNIINSNNKNISASLVLENEEERILRRTTEVIDYITNNRLRISDYMSKLSSYKDEDLIKEYVSTCDLNKGNGYLLQGFSFFLQNKIKYETEKTEKKKEATTKKKGAAVVKKAPQWNTPEYIAMFEAKPNEKPENLLQKFKQREL